MKFSSISVPKRKSVAAVTLRLPMPPSTNNLWRPGRGKMHLSDEYAAWKEEAGWELCQQHPGRVNGAYALHLRVARQDTKSDLSNLLKASEDLLQAHGVIDNDRLAEKIILEWGADEGIEITIISTREAKAA